MRTTYRMRAGRFLGIAAVGLILLGVAAVLWAVSAPGAVVGLFLALGAVIVLGGLWILARPPVLLKLGADDVNVRGVRTPWTDITEVSEGQSTQGPAIVLQTKKTEHSVLIPLQWLAPAKAAKLETELRERLNKANGYTIWDGTAGEAGDRAE
jgi:hypothetical protein